MNECLFRHTNNVRRSLLCTKNTQQKYKSVENNKINFYELITIHYI